MLFDHCISVVSIPAALYDEEPEVQSKGRLYTYITSSSLSTHIDQVVDSHVTVWATELIHELFSIMWHVPWHAEPVLCPPCTCTCTCCSCVNWGKVGMAGVRGKTGVLSLGG